MTGVAITALTIERFKSFRERTRVDFTPLTVIIGRNNSGKSSLIQAFLLLKQTLLDPRPEVSLRLEGIVDAFGLKELTFGHPDRVTHGPEITVEWECDVDVPHAIAISNPNLGELADQSGVQWLRNPGTTHRRLRTSMRLRTTETGGSTRVAQIDLISYGEAGEQTQATIKSNAEGREFLIWDTKSANKVSVELDHFIPYLSINTRNIGPRSRDRSVYNAYLVLFAQPLEGLKKTLQEFHYLGSLRQLPPSIFKPSTVSPNEIGISGELAAQLLHRRQQDIVHFLKPVTLDDDAPHTSDEVVAKPMVEAVNDMMRSLSVNAPLTVENIQEFGFRLMFGGASLVHVGRGLSYLLPLVELGLFADPIRFTGVAGTMSLSEYNQRCKSISHIALEEPEAHLHPKVASRLAHWLVSLARSNRRLIVETHSDHMVRRLRGLAARAEPGSALERWLVANVSILSVEQDSNGCSSITSSRLTSEGGVSEAWPSEFMDEATNEESAIYYAKLEKTDPELNLGSGVEMIEGDEPETEVTQ